MLIKIHTIKKRPDFINIGLNGQTYKSNSLILQKLFDKKSNNCIKVGYTATKKLGSAVKRNRAKRIMRALVRDTMNKHGKINFAYILIAKKALFTTPYNNLKEELIKLILKNEKNN